MIEVNDTAHDPMRVGHEPLIGMSRLVMYVTLKENQAKFVMFVKTVPECFSPHDGSRERAGTFSPKLPPKVAVADREAAATGHLLRIVRRDQDHHESVTLGGRRGFPNVRQ